MARSIQLNLHELKILVYWMTQRERIRTLKECGSPKPWTEDPLLRDFRWCNVRRMDDRVSRWLLEHWYPQVNPAEQLLAAAIARTINWPDALADVVDYLPALPAIRRRLHARKSQDKKIFTGAYVVPGIQGEDKIDSVLALAAAIQARAREARGLSTMRDTCLWLSSFRGLGAFLAGQITADLAVLDYGRLWPDRQSWAPVGPGSARGVNRLIGRPKARAVSQAEFEELLLAVIEKIKPQVWTIWEDRQLVAMDIQNCLCEFDKYRRLTLGEGRVRARYDGDGRQAALL